MKHFFVISGKYVSGFNYCLPTPFSFKKKCQMLPQGPREAFAALQQSLRAQNWGQRHFEAGDGAGQRWGQRCGQSWEQNYFEAGDAGWSWGPKLGPKVDGQSWRPQYFEAGHARHATPAAPRPPASLATPARPFRSRVRLRQLLLASAMAPDVPHACSAPCARAERSAPA